MTTQDRQLLIHKFLDATISPSELETMLEFKNSNDEFKAEFELAVFLHQKEKENVMGEIPGTIKKRNGFNYSKIFIAASVIAILFIGFNAFNSDGTQDYADTQIHINHSYPTVLLNPEHDAVWNQAISLYKTEDYSSFSNKLIHEIGLNQLDSQQLLFLSISELRLGKAIEAEGHLNLLLSKNNEFTSEAQWYLALTYIKQQRVSEAQETLLEIIKQKNFLSSEANELFKMLQ